MILESGILFGNPLHTVALAPTYIHQHTQHHTIQFQYNTPPHYTHTHRADPLHSKWRAVCTRIPGRLSDGWESTNREHAKDHALWLLFALRGRCVALRGGGVGGVVLCCILVICGACGVVPNVHTVPDGVIGATVVLLMVVATTKKRMHTLSKTDWRATSSHVTSGFAHASTPRPLKPKLRMHVVKNPLSSHFEPLKSRCRATPSHSNPLSSHFEPLKSRCRATPNHSKPLSRTPSHSKPRARHSEPLKNMFVFKFQVR